MLFAFYLLLLTNRCNLSTGWLCARGAGMIWL